IQRCKRPEWRRQHVIKEAKQLNDRRGNKRRRLAFAAVQQRRPWPKAEVHHVCCDRRFRGLSGHPKEVDIRRNVSNSSPRRWPPPPSIAEVTQLSADIGRQHP